MRRIFTIGDFLKLPDIEGMKLAAGYQGVNRFISSINIIDNPDSYDWLSSGELILSTGYIFRDDDEQQRAAIRRLDAIGCAGLGIKTNRYLYDIPKGMKEEADILGFPIIVLPFGRSLSNIITVVTDKIRDHHEDSRIDELLTIQQKLAAAHTASNGMREIARLATGFLQNPIIIVDSAWRLLAWEDCPQNPYPLDTALKLIKNTACFPQSFSDSMPSAFEMFRKPIVRHLPLDNDHHVICRVCPATAGHATIYGYIVVWETAKALDGFDNIVLEHVAVNAAVERVLVSEKDEAKTRVKRDFFIDLLAGNIESLHAIRSLAAMHGLPADASYRCLVLQYNSRYEDLTSVAAAKKYSETVEGMAYGQGLLVSCVTVSDGMVILYNTRETGKQEEEVINRFAQVLLKDFKEKLSTELKIIISQLVSDITKISGAYKSALMLKELKYGIHGSRVLFVDDYPVHYLLGNNISNSVLKEVVTKNIGVVIEHDKKYNSNLVDTMNVYFLCSRNISETAKRMFIHRNTCIYRIDKIKCLLNDDFTDSNSLLKYQIALIAMSLLGSEEF